MASGDTLWVLKPRARVGPATLFATPGIVADASTPVFNHHLLDFDGASDEHADWEKTIPSYYSGGGFTWSYKYAMDGTDGNIIELELRAIDLADLDVLTADLGVDTQTASTLTDDPSTTANEWNYTGTSTLSHANAGAPSVGDRMLLRLTRDISVATNIDDLQFGEAYIIET